MLLTGHQITEAMNKGTIKIVPFDPQSLQPASYDLRVGDEGFTATAGKKIDLTAQGILVLEPGDFAAVLTLERIELDASHAGRFGLRSSLGRRGVIAAIGPQVDPGFRGKLHIGLVNLSPSRVTLARGDQFCTIEFHQLAEPARKPYDGPYQDKDHITSEDIDHILQGKGAVYSEVVQNLATLNQTVGTLTTQMRGLFGLVAGATVWLTLLLSGLTLVGQGKH